MSSRNTLYTIKLQCLQFPFNTLFFCQRFLHQNLCLSTSPEEENKKDTTRRGIVLIEPVNMNTLTTVQLSLAYFI